MLDAFPIYHWFHNGNPYSGGRGRYALCHHPHQGARPERRERQEKARGPLHRGLARPWSIEHTAEEKIETQLFDGDQAGLDKAVAWLHERYTAEADRWTDIPSILDCEPDR